MFQKWANGVLAIGGLVSALCFAVTAFGLSQAPVSAPKVHTYYVAADEVEWDYAPSGINNNDGHEIRGLRNHVY